MIPVQSYKGRRVAVYGLGEPGLALCCAIVEGGAEVCAWDEAPHLRDQAQAMGINVEDLTQRDWGDLAVLVVCDAELIFEPAEHRLVSMAKSLDIPIRSAKGLLASAVIESSDYEAIIVTGRNSAASMELAECLLMSLGQESRNLIEAEAAKLLAPHVFCDLTPCEIASMGKPGHCKALIALTPDDSFEPEETGSVLRLLAEQAKTAVVVTAHAHGRSQLMSVRRDNGAVAVSGQIVVTRGVYTIGGEVFDTLAGRAVRLGSLDDLWPYEAISAAIALARLFGVDAEDVKTLLHDWPGAKGCGNEVFRVGHIGVYDWSTAQSIDHALSLLTGKTPIFWIAGPHMDPQIATALKQTPNPVRCIYLAGDRLKANAKLSGQITTVRHKNLTTAFARAMHDGAGSLEKINIVYAPACLPGVNADRFIDVVNVLINKVKDREAA